MFQVLCFLAFVAFTCGIVVKDSSKTLHEFPVFDTKSFMHKGVVYGEYSYFGRDGTTSTVHYVADKNHGVKFYITHEPHSGIVEYYEELPPDLAHFPQLYKAILNSAVQAYFIPANNKLTENKPAFTGQYFTPNDKKEI